MANQRGFTLIELLVAVAIMALMSAGAYTFISSTSNTAARLQDRQAALLSIQRMQSIIANDLNQWVDRPIRDEFGDALPPFLLTADGALEFTRRGLRNPLDKPRSDLIRVRYELRQGVLWRLSWMTLDRLQGLKPVASPISPPMEQLRWRVMASNQSQTLQTWPPISAGSGAIRNAVVDQGAPRVINLDMVFEAWGQIRRVYRLPDNDNG